MFVSIMNDVIGPVMRGPSSSHTAGSYHIGRTLRSMLDGEPQFARFTFDCKGSYAQTYAQQGADRGFALGLMGVPLTDERFLTALEFAQQESLDLDFIVSELEYPDHPNKVEIELVSQTGDNLKATAASTGGGTFCISQVDGWSVDINGKQWHLLVFCSESARTDVREILNPSKVQIHKNESDVLIECSLDTCPIEPIFAKLNALDGVAKVVVADPVFHVRKGKTLFNSACEMAAYARRHSLTLGQSALEYEAQLLGLKKTQLMEEMIYRYGVMRDAVSNGLDDSIVNMQLLEPTAAALANAEKSKCMPIGGLHATAATTAMAVMHACNSMGVVCAAPTGGSAGVIPGTMIALADKFNIKSDQAAMMLFAAGAIGLIIAKRSTFAAEVAGCQVEIGSAGAMAAAAVIEYSNGTVIQANDAAAIALQNSMGSVCDLVQGTCEIPCHTRNAVAASNAFVCADLIMGGYHNPVNLDETIDAVYSCGKMLPSELRCTSKGGIAIAPSAQNLPKRR